MIIERDCHTDIMQRRRIALQTLNGVGIGMKDIRVVQHLARLLRSPLQQIVVVGIDTGYHSFTQTCHQSSLLASLQFLM